MTVPLSLPGIVAGALLCFIPIVGEFVIPDLLGGSNALMIGQTLWTEFFSNQRLAGGLRASPSCCSSILLRADRDLPAPADARELEGALMRKASIFNVTSVALGLAFLYLPIAILVIYSFNASRLVTVWGGWSTRWYVALLHDRAMLDAAWTSLRIAVAVGDARRPCSARWRRWRWSRAGRFRGRLLFSGMIYAPLVMPEVITGLSLLLLFVALDLDRGFWTVDDRAHHADAVLRHRGGAVAAA